ncbi:MAG TPA: hypothetical protein VEH83_06175 [Gemmatimonadales bacterium]|nr:hypothetical protein [Gemmatimonadales bacterium]
MAATTDRRTAEEFAERPDALAAFLRAAGSAPRLITVDDSAGCPLYHALAALQWTGETGLFQPSDRLHAAWFAAETGVAVIERVVDDKPVYRFLGPRIEAPQKPPVEGTPVVDEAYVLGYEFTERWNAIAHFLVTTQGRGAVIALFAPRAPELDHVRRWLLQLFKGPVPEGADHLHAAWFATTSAGFLFPPTTLADRRTRGWAYVELGNTREE